MDFLIDANIIIDYLEEREGFFEDAEEVIDICTNKKFRPFLAPHTVSIIYYVTSKNRPPSKVKLELLGLLEYIDIVPAGRLEMVAALNYEGISDFEDALQAVCAEKANAKFIVTRDVRGFENSKVSAMSPKEFIEKYSE